jgi:hypothetical protein
MTVNCNAGMEIFMKMIVHLRQLSLLVLFFGLLAAVTAKAQTSVDALKQGFRNPPNSARPQVWWHWMNGNITESGIKLDMEWMKRIGIGGVTAFDIDIDTPQVVPHRLVYMTPQWKDAFRFAEATANKLGLEMAIASSPGWGETGGPWVPPAQAMKKMVWSATRIDGGGPYIKSLSLPPNTTGTFQNYSIQSSEEGNAGGGKLPLLPQFYADSAVIAYRIPADDKTQAELLPRVTSSGGNANVAALSDGDVEKVALRLPSAAPGKKAWIQFEYATPQTIQAVTLATLDDMINIFGIGENSVPRPLVEASNDGQSFRHVIDIPPSSVPQRTASFPVVKARFFRISFPTPSSSGNRQAPSDHIITELVFHSGARVNQFEKKAGFATAPDYYAIGTPKVMPGSVVQKKDVIDLTAKMKPDGSLDWTPPPGKWMVLRIGYSLTGHQNAPAPPESTGLEVDKLNRKFVHNYIDTYLKTYSDTVGPSLMGKSGVGFLLTDSWEAGSQNWTDDMIDEFARRRGYDPYIWLPALTGVIIQSPEATDRFLWDFRRTIAELIAQNHYGEISSDLHRHGMGYYSEALEFRRPTLGDDMEMRRPADVPMGAMWTFPGGQPISNGDAPDPTYIADLRGAASVAHIYGQNFVGAESMTSGGPAWGYSPSSLKMMDDLQFALGANRIMIHESTHQPLVNQVPGLTLGHNGLWFNRNDTWAEQAAPWILYLARNSYMLQQGHFYGDVAYFYGQEGPLTALFGWQPQHDAPHGYGFDFVNSDVLLNHLSVQNGRLVTPGGTSYRILYLGGSSSRMTLSVLRRLRDLVSSGAVVVGNKPIDSPSLADNEEEFHRITDQLWGKESMHPFSVRSFGKGRIYSGMTANEVLTNMHISRDFEYTQPELGTKLMFLHRRLSDGDIYYVDNRENRAETVSATFRVQGKAPKFWHADTGIIERASYSIADGRTMVQMHLDPYGTVFVVFRKPTMVKSRTLPRSVSTPLSIVHGPWNVSFQPNRGAPSMKNLDHLKSWSENSNDGIKYFSGTATYTKVIQAPANWFHPASHLWLNLGEVKNLAEVEVNGKPLGIVWKSPYKVDMTSALKPGANVVKIRVTNLWVNRLIGDQQPDVLKKYTFTDIRPYNANSPLLPSGLLGPVQVWSITPQ